MLEYARGSEWRKWDLHVHTPASVLNNGYGQDWDVYVYNLFSKAIENKISVIGITDYFSIEGYKKITTEYINNDQKLSSIFEKEIKSDPAYLEKIKKITIFPNIELRLDNVVTASRSNGQITDNKLEYHVIFSNDIPSIDIETMFLSNLSISISNPQTGRIDQYPLSATVLERLGQKYKVEQTEYSNFDDFHVGCIAASINLKDLNEAKTKTEGFLKDKVIFISAQDDISRINFASSAGSLRKDIITCSNAIFSANPNSIKWGIKEETRKEFGHYFPCLWGSDSHSFDTLFKVTDDRFCWIKADPTFEGLKQAIIQPKERIFIGKEPNKLTQIVKSPNIFIEAINLNRVDNPKNKNDWWFDFPKPIPVNPGMVAIIGSKGSGKSALSDIIGHFCYCKTVISDASFLTEKRFRKSPKRYANDYEGSISWVDNHTDKKMDLMISSYPSSVEKAQYLPQKYIETVCNNLDNEFQDEIDKVIFSYVDEKERMGQSSLKALIDAKNSDVDSQWGALCLKINKNSNEMIILQDKKSKEYKVNIEDNIVALKEQLTIHKNNKPVEVLPPVDVVDEEEIQKIDFLTNQINKREKRLKFLNEKYSEISIQLEEIKKFEIRILQAEESAKLLNKDINDFLIKNLFSKSENPHISMNINTKFLNLIKEDLTRKLDSIKLFCASNTKQSYSLKIESLNQKKNILIQKTNEEQQQYQKYINEYKQWGEKKLEIIGSPMKTGSLRYFIKEKNYLKNNLNIDFKKVKSIRKSLIEEAYNLLIMKSKVYEDIYAPVKQKLIEILGKIDNDIQFTVDIVFKEAKLEEKILGYINKRMTSNFRGVTEGIDFIANLKKQIELGKKSTVIKFVNEILVEIDKSETPAKLVYDRLEFFNYIIALDFLDVSFSLKMAGRDISDLSAGEKGILLLVFYLALNKENKPLIIDQPEDNLDNKSVFDKLVPCIQEAKTKRQLIVVTHNPNIAIACDAEQVIYCNINKKKGNKISYSSGSIENPEIRKHIIDILEGTEPAFSLRKLKYRI